MNFQVFVFQDVSGLYLGTFWAPPAWFFSFSSSNIFTSNRPGKISTSAVQTWGKKIRGNFGKVRREHPRNNHDSKNYGTMISNSKFQQIIPGMICHLIQVCYDDWKKNLRNKMRQLLNKVSVFDAGIVCNMHVLRIHEAFSC